MAALELDSRFLVGLVQAVGSPVSTRCDLLEAAGRQSLRIVLASAWQSEGEALNPSLEHEVSFWRGQVDRYQSVYGELAASVEGLTPVKGFRIGSLYPAGWVRDCCDLDLVAASRDSLWRAGEWLIARGWQATGMAVVQVEGEPEVALSLTRPSRDPWLCDLETVEISSLSFVGNGWTVSAARRLPGDEGFDDRVRQLAALTEERCERPYHGRDVLDAVVLLDRLPPPDLEAFLRLVDRLKLWPEWVELARRSRRLAPLPEGALPRWRRLRGELGSALVRGVRGVLSSLSPGRVAGALLERWTVLRTPSPRRLRIGWWIHERLPPARVLASGWPLFGLYRSPAQPRPGDLTIDRRGGRLIAGTPVGTFELLYSGVAKPDWFSEGPDTAAGDDSPLREKSAG